MIKKRQNKILKQYLAVVILTIISFVACTYFIKSQIQNKYKDYWECYPAAAELQKEQK